MNKQQVLLWCFPEQTDKQELDYDHITTKRFLFMSTVGIAIIILSQLLLN
jgi:hypothetical protein